MNTYQAEYPVRMMCRLLEVSTSGYYAWRRRAPAARTQTEAVLRREIAAIYAWSDGTYGVPRMVIELRARDYQVNHKRVARLMRAAGLAGVSRRRWVRTTRPDRQGQAAPDLVQRDLTAVGPNELWVADVTYMPTWIGFLFLAVVLDVWSRRVIGWAMAAHLRTELVLSALDMALQQRRLAAVIHHSDHGGAYTSLAFGQRCREWHVRPSMGSVGDAYNNALCESFSATLECELIDRRIFRTHSEARRALFTYIEGWYNPHRQHSAMGHESPMNYERRHHPAA